MPCNWPIAELNQIEQLCQQYAGLIRRKPLCQLSYQQWQLPIDALELGTTQANQPCVIIVGGIHGVERIGSQVVLAYLHCLLARLRWDRQLQQTLAQIQVVFIPLMNPIGVWRMTRANGNGVDLMRNGQYLAQMPVAWMVGGQRWSKHLPWYQGNGLEPEAQALINYVHQQHQRASYCISIDVHSGYGMHDQLWFPLANSYQPIRYLADIYALKQLFDSSYPHHSYYHLTPQWHHYCINGDLWDHIYLARQGEAPLLNFTLELGSWRWIKKNPLQALRFSGYFNPVKAHRQQRILRRHTIWFDFILQASYSLDEWQLGPLQQQELFLHAQDYWRYATPHCTDAWTCP